MGAPVHTHFGMASNIYQVAINASSSGNNTIVSAVSGRIIIVLSYKLIAAGPVLVTWESSGGSVLDGPCSFDTNGGEVNAFCEHGHFRTPRGEGLVLDLSGAVQVGGHLLYGLI